MAMIPESIKDYIVINEDGIQVINPIPEEMLPIYNDFVQELQQEYDGTVWNPEYHLNHISDQMMGLALNLLNQGLIGAVRKILLQEGTVGFSVEFWMQEPCAFGTYDDPEHMQRRDKSGALKCSPTDPIATCGECVCGMERCPVRLAGYIRYLMETNQFEEMLAERNSFRGQEGFADRPLNYEWVPEDDGLKHMPEKDYQLGLTMANRGFVQLRPYLDAEGRFLIDFCGVGGCRKKDEDKDSNVPMLQAAVETRREPVQDLPQGWMMFPGRSVTRRPTMCAKCEAGYCPYLTAAYIRYCQVNHLQDRLEADRAYAAAHPEEIVYGPGFEFNFDDGVIKEMKHFISSVSDETLSTALWLLDTNRAYLLPTWTDEDNGRRYFRIATSFRGDAVVDSKSLQEFRERAEKADGEGDIFMPGGLNGYEGIKPGIQIIRLAGTLDYLRRRNIDYSDAIRYRTKVLEEFMEKTSEIEGLDRILSLAQNPNSDSLYCILQGNRNTGKKAVIQQIASVLAKHGKIQSSEYTHLTLEQASELLTKHKVSRDSFDRLSTGYEYFNFEPNQLYVLTGVEKFLTDYNCFKEDIHDETRNSAYLHLAKILGRFIKDTYVIIVGEEKHIKEFLGLDSKYRFLYGNSIMKFPDLTKHEIYERYKEELSDDIQAKITDEAEFEREFTEYITFNEKFLPFGNSELSNYLANYSNVEGQPVLPPSMYDERKTKQQLDDIVGMDAVKQQVKDFESFIAFQKRAEAAGISVGKSNLHMQFIGNPGTGKTTIARIIAAMLFDIGVLKEDKLVEVERKDLVAQYVGQTAVKTTEKIKEAMGGVLFVDEAYSLTQGDDAFGKEALATLIKAMEEHRDELIVIFAGYDKEMEDFLKANPGIESRIGYTFRFADYQPSELAEMFRRNMTRQGFETDAKVVAAVEEICAHYSKRKNFGNGRFVDKIEQQTIINHSKNASAEGWDIKKITLADIPDVGAFGVKISSGDSQALTMDQIVGLKNVKEQLGKFRNKIAFEQKAKSLGIDIPKGNNHMLFMGNPGTGKTTVARIIAQELYNAGIIAENRLTETSPNDLVAEYVGQTGPKTQAVIDRAMGGVLFVDEAYQLAGSGSGNFGAEALTTLIKAMEDHRDEFVCIFAGYEEDMQRFLDVNAGIASRVGYTFHFEDYTAEELTQIFKGKIDKSGLKCEDPEVLRKVQEVMQYFTSVPNFGNGRFAERVSNIVYELHSEHCIGVDDADRIRNISVEDIPDVETIIAHLPDGQDMIRPKDITDAQNERTAIHELGHALICKIFFPDNPIERITIAAEGNGALGYVRYNNKGRVGNATATQLKNRICVCMAGIASEEVFLGEYGNGGTSDLEQATNIADNMIGRYGMSKHGFAVRKKTDAEAVEAEADELLSEQFAEAKRLIGEYREGMLKAKQQLLEKRTITDEEFSRIMGFDVKKA